MNRPLIVIGSVLILLGLLWPWVQRLHLLHLPGDFIIERPGFRLFVPLTTMLIVSVALSLLAWLMRR